MKQRKTQLQLLDELVADGSLDIETRDNVLKAPKWIIESRELVMYLSTLVITAGALQIVGFVVVGSSRNAFAGILYLFALVAGFFSVRLETNTLIRERLSEVLEMASVLALSIATGIVVSNWDIDSRTYVIAISGVAVIWGVARSVQTKFSGTFIMVAGIPVLVVSSASIINVEDSLIMGIMLVVAGCLMIGQSLRRIGFPFLVRAAGATYIVIGSFLMTGYFSGIGKTIPIIIGGLLFAFGARRFAPEIIIAGAFCITVGAVMASSEWLPNGLAQGATVIASGTAMLFITMKMIRKPVTSLSPDAPSV